jgi:hypothetical protein
MPSLILAEITPAALIAVTAIIGGLCLTAVIIIFGLKHAQRTQELWHETARLALEKGLPMPPTPEELRVRTAREAANDDFRSGLISLAAGIGLYYFLGAFLGRALGAVGFIPMLVGLAMLLHAGLSAWFSRKNKVEADR